LRLYDVLGVGFGPANVALAIALEEGMPGTAALFLEAQRDPVWQRGMLLDGSNIQNHPCRDLVSLRNPRSRYTFINYLFEEGRLLEHLNLPVEFPLRKEYAQYISWTTGHMAYMAEFGAPVRDIRLTRHQHAMIYTVRTAGSACRHGRSLVLAPGRTPYVPAPFDTVSSPRVVHLTQYLNCLETLATALTSVAVIGGSQSAVELMLDLAKRFPRARITTYVRSFGLRLKDTSPFSEEGFFPDFTTYYHRASRASKHELDTYLRLTNYSSADDDVLKELYLLLYEERLEGRQRLSVRGNRQVYSVRTTDSGVDLGIAELHTGARERDTVDLVVLATGFRDLGPGPHQEPYPPLLAGIVDRFRFDADGYLVVGDDYRLAAHDDGTPPLFLNGLCESSHGIGDSGSFSLLSVRAAVIRDSLRACLPGPTNHVQPRGAATAVTTTGLSARHDPV
jgi:L-ornithine N5-oxygenase